MSARVVIHPGNGYAADPGISLRAKGVMAMVMGLSAETDVSPREWALAHSHESSVLVDPAIEELRQAGYLLTGRLRNARGRVYGAIWEARGDLSDQWTVLGDSGALSGMRNCVRDVDAG